MSDKDTSIPAFPCDRICHGKEAVSSTGMSLRDYFAAKAMTAVIRDWQKSWDIYQDADTAEVIARDCYIVADAMLKARQS